MRVVLPLMTARESPSGAKEAVIAPERESRAARGAKQCEFAPQGRSFFTFFLHLSNVNGKEDRNDDKKDVIGRRDLLHMPLGTS